jgi:Cu-Zn family superoxide dismutase
MASPLRVLPLVLLVSTTLACGGDDGMADTTAATTTSTPATESSGSTGPQTTATTAVDDPSAGPTSDDGPVTGTTAPDPDTTSGESGDGTTAGVVSASATLEPKSGSNASGTAVFTNAGDGTADLVVDLAGVAPPGTHALHIHEFPDCSSPDGESAGMHWNPAGTMLGELGTVEIADDGTGVFMKSDAWSIGTGRDNDVVGRSIVIHADPDGGTRIACGVIVLD